MFDPPTGELPVEEQAKYLLGLPDIDEGVRGGCASDRTKIAVLSLHADWKRLASIVRLTREVRGAQKRYFRDRSGFQECKMLESRLDGLLRE